MRSGPATSTPRSSSRRCCAYCAAESSLTCDAPGGRHWGRCGVRMCTEHTTRVGNDHDLAASMPPSAITWRRSGSARRRRTCGGRGSRRTRCRSRGPSVRCPRRSGSPASSTRTTSPCSSVRAERATRSAHPPVKTSTPRWPSPPARGWSPPLAANPPRHTPGPTMPPGGGAGSAASPGLSPLADSRSRTHAGSGRAKRLRPASGAPGLEGANLSASTR